jgi:hypothetical protein
MDLDVIVDDERWQDLRGSFRGRWTTEPHRCVRELREYLGTFEDPLRVCRAFNLLNGTAFRLGRIADPDIDALKADLQWWYARHKEVLDGKRPKSGLRDLARTFTPTKRAQRRPATAAARGL